MDWKGLGRKGWLSLVMALLLLIAGTVALTQWNRNASDKIAPTSQKAIPPDLIVSDNVVTNASGSVVHNSDDFTSALQWAVAQPGKVVCMPPGRYEVTDSIALQDSVVLEGGGDGEQGTVLDFNGNGNHHTRILISSGVNNTTLMGFRVTGKGNIELDCDGTTCGNHTIQNVTAYQTSSSHEASFQMVVLNKGVLEDVRFIGCKAIETGNIGFLSQGDGYSAPGGVANMASYAGWIRNITYSSCLADHCGYSERYNPWVVGFDLAESVNVENVTCDGCTAMYNWESGFHFEPSPMVMNATMVNCTASNNGQKPDDYSNGDGTTGLWFGKGFYWVPGRTTVDVVNCNGEGNAHGLFPY